MVGKSHKWLVSKLLSRTVDEWLVIHTNVMVVGKSYKDLIGAPLSKIVGE